MLINTGRVFEPKEAYFEPPMAHFPNNARAPSTKIHRRIKRFMIRFARQGL